MDSWRGSNVDNLNGSSVGDSVSEGHQFVIEEVD